MLANPFISFFVHNSVAIPLWQLAVFILIIIFFLMIKNYSVGLKVAYFLVFLWVFILNFSHFQAIMGDNWVGMSIFLLFGFVMGLFGVMSLFS